MEIFENLFESDENGTRSCESIINIKILKLFSLKRFIKLKSFFIIKFILSFN